MMASTTREGSASAGQAKGGTLPLTPEESLLWECARTWHEFGPAAAGGPHASLPSGQRPPPRRDWQRLVEIGQTNRMQPFLLHSLQRAGLVADLPTDVLDLLQRDVDRLKQSAVEMGGALRHYLECAAEQGLQTVVIKGLSVSVNVYGSPDLRPGGDVDLLVRRDQVDASLKILERMGLGQWWPNLLDDADYDRHHLHQQRCTPDLKIWFEVHWALDHPYTLLTIDYEALFDRTTPGELLGQPVCDLAAPDLLLGLAVHLVKHAVYLPSVLDRPDLPRIILADGMLLYYLDVAEAIKCYSAGLDWESVVDLARGSGAVDVLGSVFQVCREHLGAPVPEWVVDALPVQGPAGPVRKVMNQMADYEVVRYLGQRPNRFWHFMVATNGAFILRPIRVLDTAAYFFPGTDFLQRRYGRSSPSTAVWHLFRAAGQYGRLGVDTGYYTWRRHRRLRSLGQSASLFNRLDVNG